MLKYNTIQDVSLDMVRQWKDVHAMDDGLVLTNRILDVSVAHSACRLNFIVMALCLRGTASYSINTSEQKVTAGDLLFISERHIIDNYCVSLDFACQCIMVSSQFYHGFVQNTKNVSSLLLFSRDYPVVQLMPHEAQTYSNYFQTVLEKMEHKDHPYRTELVKAQLLAMFYDMSGVIYRLNHHEQKAKTRAEAFFATFIHLLEENFRSERRVSWYAEQMGISPKYLSEVVKQVSMRTPTEWIDSYVLLEIRVLLKNSSKSMKEITDELHFPNQSFMGKYFKERLGMTLSEFRKQ